MIDMHVQQLLKHAVDTPIKLHLLLIFHEHAIAETTSAHMSERACRDIWSVKQALDELAEDGILQILRTNGDQPHYRYHPSPDYLRAIHVLIDQYYDPLERNELHRSLRELAPYVSLRRNINRSQAS